jgi:hypothetical protein
MSAATIAVAMPPLKDLRPIDGTSAAVRAAFDRLADARAANADEIDRLEAARPGLLLSGTPAEIDKTDENLRRRRIFAEQLDLLDPELRRLFTEAEQQEQDAAFDSALAEIRVAEVAWNARVQAEYPALAAALADLMAAEITLRNSYATLTSLPAAGRKLHRQSITMHDLTAGMRRVKLGPAFSASHLADIVRAPALAPPAGEVGR